MVIKVCRHKHGTDSTFGALFINDFYLCSTLENSHKLIPPGRYKAEIYDSPTKGKVILLKDVPGRSFIEIHVANYWHQLEGCIAVGTNFNTDMLMQSKLAFGLVMMQAAGADSLEVHIVETE